MDSLASELDLEWRPVADAAALSALAGSRVRFLCLDACTSHVALGASTGRRGPAAQAGAPRRLRRSRSVYLFARTRVGSREGPLKFVSIVTPEPLARQLSAGGARAALPSPAASPGRGAGGPPPSAALALKFHPARTSLALATAAGELYVVDLGLVRGARSPREDAAEASAPGRGAGRQRAADMQGHAPGRQCDRAGAPDPPTPAPQL